MERGEIPIELGYSWYTAKTIKVEHFLDIDFSEGLSPPPLESERAALAGEVSINSSLTGTKSDSINDHTGCMDDGLLCDLRSRTFGSAQPKKRSSKPKAAERYPHPIPKKRIIKIMSSRSWEEPCFLDLRNSDLI